MTRDPRSIAEAIVESMNDESENGFYAFLSKREIDPLFIDLLDIIRDKTDGNDDVMIWAVQVLKDSGEGVLFNRETGEYSIVELSPEYAQDWRGVYYVELPYPNLTKEE